MIPFDVILAFLFTSVVLAVVLGSDNIFVFTQLGCLFIFSTILVFGGIALFAGTVFVGVAAKLAMSRQ